MKSDFKEKSQCCLLRDINKSVFYFNTVESYMNLEHEFSTYGYVEENFDKVLL